MRGPLAPADSPLTRSRAEQFDDLVLQAVAQLEPRWETELAAIEFAVEEVPRVDPGGDDGEPVPLARTEPATIVTGVPGPAASDADPAGSFGPGDADLRNAVPGGADPEDRDPGDPDPVDTDPGGGAVPGGTYPGTAVPAEVGGRRVPAADRGPLARPARIVLYRRPLLARADGEEELGELVLDVVVEEFAKLIGVDPETVDPGQDDQD